MNLAGGAYEKTANIWKEFSILWHANILSSSVPARPSAHPLTTHKITYPVLYRRLSCTRITLTIYTRLVPFVLIVYVSFFICGFD